VILVLVGVKMLLVNYVRIPITAMLGGLAAVLLVSIALSVAFPKPAKAKS
jgi:hypothetical protein